MEDMKQVLILITIFQTKLTKRLVVHLTFIERLETPLFLSWIDYFTTAINFDFCVKYSVLFS